MTRIRSSSHGQGSKVEVGCASLSAVLSVWFSFKASLNFGPG